MYLIPHYCAVALVSGSEMHCICRRLEVLRSWNRGNPLLRSPAHPASRDSCGGRKTANANLKKFQRMVRQPASSRSDMVQLLCLLN